MTKGKRRRQRERRGQAAEQSHEQGASVGVELTKAKQDAIQQDHAESAKDAAEEDENMSLKTAISQWTRENANVIIAAFTVVIAIATIIQACIYSSQLDEMRIDQRAWLAVKFTANS